MSSIRIRLSRMWNNLDAENTNPTDSRRPSTTNSLTLTQDSGFWGNGSLRSRSNTSSLGLNTTSADHLANIEAKDSNYNGPRSASRFSSSTRSIHDVVSSTFRFVSDALRSKTKLFYVESARSVTPFPVEANTSSKHPQKPRILSSLRSRRSQCDKLNLEARPVVASYTHVPEIPHKLHVDIPDHTLLQPGSNVSDDALFGTISSDVSIQASEFLPQWTIPKHFFALKEFLDESEAEICTSGSDSAIQRSSEKAGIELQSPDAYHTHRASEPSEAKSLHNEIYAEDTTPHGGNPSRNGSQTDRFFKPSALGASKPTRHFRISGNLFVKGNREQNRRIGSPSPYQRVLRSDKSCEALSEHLVRGFGPTDSSNTQNENSFLFRPSISRATSFTRGLSNLVMIDGESGEVGENLAIEGKSSDCYDGDAESCDEIPNMGPRSPWDKARADRLKRYQLVRTMSAATESDNSEDSGLRLRPYKEICKFRPISPADISDSNRKVHTAMRDDNGQNIEGPHKTNSRDVWYEANEPLVESGHPTPAMEACNHTFPDLHENDRCFSDTSITHALETIKIHDGAIMHSSEEVSYDDYGSSVKKAGPEKSTHELPEINARCLRNGAVTSLRPSSGRKISSYSISTTDSCAITTSSPLCYRKSSIPSVHVHTTPVRRTSSINDEIHQVRDEAEGGDSFIVHPIIAESVAETVCSLEVHPPCPSSNMFPIDSELASLTQETDEIQQSRNGFNTEYEEQGHSSECLLKGMRLCDNELSTEAQMAHMSLGFNSRDVSCTSSMCAPMADFVQEDLSGTREDVTVSESAPESIKAVCSVMDSLKFSFVIDDKALSYESEDMGTWLAEHPDAESLGESEIDLADHGNESDFFPANPELDYYLDQDFPEITRSEGKAERSDDGNDGFQTPLATPSKCAQMAKLFSSSLRMQLSEMDAGYHCKLGPIYCGNEDIDTVLGKPPPFRPTQSAGLQSPSGKTSFPHDSTESFGEANLHRDTTPNTMGHRRSKRISWQMRDSSYGGEDFTYEAIGSPQQALQTSSSKKGVWWGRELNSDLGPESPLGAKPDGDISSHECDTEEEVFRHILHPPYRMPTGNDHNLLALLATANIRNGDGSSTTATGVSDSIDGNEDSIDINQLDTRSEANECVTTTKDNCITAPSNDPEVSEMHHFPSAIGTLTELNEEPGQDANKLGGFFAPPLHHDQRLQARGQENQTTVEPYQGKTLVTDSIEDFRVVGAWPRPAGHARGQVSEDSWYSFQ